MKAIYLDCFAGISGNMLLGAFLQAGVPEKYLKDELAKMKLSDEFTLHCSHVKKNGIAACYVEVKLENQKHEKHEKHEKDVHDHGNKHHEHRNENTQVQPHAHDHRTMADIRGMIGSSRLAEPIKEKSIRIFEVLAQAEGKVHNMPVEEVHFHEVGAVDSIVDIVGTAICLEYLRIEKVYTSRLNVGSGFVRCAHGLMPVPAPATAELLAKVPFYHEGAEKELTTPTGAAVIKALAKYRANLPQGFETDCIAYGAGTWELAIPNVLRLYLGDLPADKKEPHFLLTTNIDDSTPQLLGYTIERLFAAGALDAWFMPIFMKKNRPAQMLSVLTDEVHKEDCINTILCETTSIGMRIQSVDRVEAERHIEAVTTVYGEVPCKVSCYKGTIVSVSAEYDVCCKAALQYEVPLKSVQQKAVAEFWKIQEGLKVLL